MFINHNDPTSEKASQTIILVVVAALQFIGPFLVSSVTVALPAIGRELNAGAAQLGQVINIMVLATVTTLLPVGRLSDIYGRRRIFIVGTSILALVTAWLGCVVSIELFLALRFVQGIGNAMVMVTGFAILTSYFPPERRGRAMGFVVAMVSLGMSAGPGVAGIIINYLGWRWIFFSGFGVIGIALLMTLVWLKNEWIVSKNEPFDYLGTVIFIISTCMLVVGATRLVEHRSAKWLLSTGAIGLVIFIYVELKTSFPLVDLQLLRCNQGFVFSNLATFFNFASTTSFVFFVSLYLQYAKGFSPTKAGLLLTIQPVAQAIVSPFAGKLADHFSPSRVSSVGMAFCTFGLLSAAFIHTFDSSTYLVSVMLLIGLGLGVFSSPNITAIMNSVGPRHHGAASSLVSTMRNMGVLFCTTAITAILSYYLGKQPVTSANIYLFLGSMRLTFFFFTILCLVGTILSLVMVRK